MRFLKWLFGALTDPIQGTMSSTRFAGLLCSITGCVIAVKHPDQSATVAALISGGAVALLTRVKSDAP